MQVPVLLRELIQTDHDVASFVDGTLAHFEPWVGNSQMPLFPEYTDHSLTHVEDVMKTAVDLSTAKARTLLSAKDAAVLVLSVCLHDAAMHLTEDGFISLVQPGSRWHPIEGFDDQPWDVLWQDFLGDARRFDGRKLIALFGDAEPIVRPTERVTDLTKRDRLLMGEFIRRHHARLAHEIARYGIPGPDGTSALLINQSSELRRWLADLAGLTARSHGMPVRDAIGYLQRNYHVRDFNGVHVVFLMALIRVADYLQIQAKRAPTEALEVRKLASPISQGEWKVHASIRNITRAHDDPEAVHIDARPSDVKSYLRARDWLDGIQSELDTSWAVLGEVYGRYTQERLNEFGIELRRVRSNLDNIEQFAKSVNYVPAQVSFEAANPDLLKLLVGPLYSDRPEVGLRELIQNAVDAVREMNEFLSRRPDLQRVSRVEQDTDVKIVIQCEKDAESHRGGLVPISMTISDRGMGMSLDIVQNYFLKAGASFRRSDAWRQEFEDEAGHSNVLRSGRFGVGALASFLIGDRIEVTSRHIESPPDRGVSFRVSLDDESVLLNWVSCPVGTTISIPIPRGRRKAVQQAFELFRVDDDKELCNTHGLAQYISSQPSVSRFIEVAGGSDFALTVINTIPVEGEAASSPWRFFNTKDYSGIFWTYSGDFPKLVCNGLNVILDNNSGNRSLTFPLVKEDVLTTPNVVIYDRDGKLPLNLQRTSLRTSDLKLSAALLADVVDDLVAYALVDGPKEVGSRRSYQWLKGWYEGFNNRYLTPRASHRWFISRSGFGLVDPRLACTGNVSAFVIIYPLSGLKPDPKLELHEYLGSILAHLEPDIRLMFSHGFHYDATNDVKLIARSLLNDSNFYEILPRKLADWMVSGRRVFLRKSLMASFQANATFGRWLRSVVNNAIAESEDDDWVVFCYGTCPVQQVLRQDNPVLLQAKNASIAAVVECYPVNNQAAESAVAQGWMGTLGAPIIPFDETMRKSLFSDVYEKLKSHVALWQANVVRDRTKSNEDLSDVA